MIRKTIAALSVLATASGSAWAADVDAGQKIAAGVCTQCHGLNGNSESPDFPKLGGQYPDYLAKALRDYQSGARNNVIMKGFATTLKPEDIDNVAAWYSTQPPVLGIKR